MAVSYQSFLEQYLVEEVTEYPNTTSENNNEVTVKVVTYNHVKYIAQCLDSILKQETTFNFHILIAEDESNDGTREICIEYAKKHPKKIKLLLNSRKNNIPSNNKPTGLFNSVYANFNIHTPYMAMIEGDDYWTDPYSLQKRYDFLQANQDFVMCYHAIEYYDSYQEAFTGRRYPTYTESKTIEAQDMLKRSMPTSTILFRNNKVEIFENGMKDIVCGDVILRGKLCQYGKSRFLSNISPSVYRLHSGGIHSTLDIKQKYQEIIAARNYLIDYYKQKKWDPTPIHESLSHNYISQFVTILKVDKRIDIKSLRRSFGHSQKGVTGIFSILWNSLFKPFVYPRLGIKVSQD